MALPKKFDPEAKKLETQEKNKQYKNEGGAKRTLEGWLEDSNFYEYDDNAITDHVLIALTNNENNFNQLLTYCKVVTKFTKNAIQANQSYQWIKVIEQALQNIEKSRNARSKSSNKMPLADLYISKHRCLKATGNNYDEKAINCLLQAIEFSKDKQEYIESKLELAQYYENISEYEKMREILLEVEKYCNSYSPTEENLARLWVLWGQYYFFQFNFYKCRQYLIPARAILEKLDNRKNLELVYRALSTCYHYIGRTYFEEYQFKKAAIFYTKAQTILEENNNQRNLLDSLLSTAFYHLRLGQILDICKIRDSAFYHYEESYKIFQEYYISKSGLAQVKLAKANMTKEYPAYQDQSHRQTFETQETEIIKARDEAYKIGYYRGYLLALVQLFWFYVTNLRFYLAWQTGWKALASDEFKKSGGILLLYRYAKKMIFGIFYKIRFIIWRKLNSDKVLYRCPCSIHQNNKYEN
ncbi:hypothetical protein ACE1B6_16220 [Aerosakkonemataceae cyanobacterium BLCC-F154]|uniref:Tetratricopeptide repeat protein n=1 Tax=Floridaenema fluviatile BLCC-F154 TaxID=3153640 RepID=A0ABV4YE72_9CYAN